MSFVSYFKFFFNIDCFALPSVKDPRDQNFLVSGMRVVKFLINETNLVVLFYVC